MLKSGACGRPLLNIHEKTIFLSSRQAFCLQKKKYWKNRFKHHIFTQPKTKKKWRTDQRKTNGKKHDENWAMSRGKDPPFFDLMGTDLEKDIRHLNYESWQAIIISYTVYIYI